MMAPCPPDNIMVLIIHLGAKLPPLGHVPDAIANDPSLRASFLEERWSWFAACHGTAIDGEATDYTYSV